MSLRAQAVSGAKWTTVSAVVTAVLQFVQLAVLARILAPSDFGLMAMLLVVIGFAQAYSDMGISNAIIHRQDTTIDQLSSMYWLNVMAGIGVFLVLFAATPLIASLYREPRLEALLRNLIVIFLIAPFGQQFQVLLQKTLRFKALALCEICSRTTGFIVAVLLAWSGFGVFSLIWGALAASAVLTVILILVGWRQHHPRLHFSIRETRSFFQFGLYQMGERSINFFIGSLDKLIIGRILGADALGYYNLAWNLVLMPISRINPILTRVAFPVFAKLQDNREALKKGYFKIMNLLSHTNFVLLFGMAAVAPVFVPVVFGNQWIAAVPLVQVLALVACFISIGNPVGSLLLSQGRADLGFKWNGSLLLSQFLGLLLGVHWGALYGVAIALLVLHTAYFLLSYPFLISTLLGPCRREYVASILPGFWTSLTMGLATWGTLLGLMQTPLDQHLLLALSISVGALYLFVVVYTLRRNDFLKLLRAYVYPEAQHT